MTKQARNRKFEAACSYLTQVLNEIEKIDQKLAVSFVRDIESLQDTYRVAVKLEKINV
jgi:hypothetical protein